ncbi:MAG: tetratricopeptide repeat protein [Candidatus Promineifilaceae bacterium]|jgi:tetratricopeptide (TPR) repeat protein
MDLETTIAKAKALRKEDELEQSLELLESLLAEYPDNPQVIFEVGGAFDVLGEEAEAIPHYKRAIEEGLEGDDLEECLICLGSCHRAIGEFQEAVDVLEAYLDRFPERRSGHPFLAIAYYSNRQYEDAVSLLLDTLLETTSDEGILSFAGPLEYFSGNLNEVWEN